MATKTTQSTKTTQAPRAVKAPSKTRCTLIARHIEHAAEVAENRMLCLESVEDRRAKQWASQRKTDAKTLHALAALVKRGEVGKALKLAYSQDSAFTYALPRGLFFLKSA